MAAALLQYQACLGILVRLQVEDLSLLKADFDRLGRGLSLREFVSAMLERVRWDVESVVAFIEDLVELFAQVDVNGDGAMEWEEFTSAIIEGGMGTSSDATEWRDMKYEENPRFAGGGAGGGGGSGTARPPKRVQLVPECRRLLLYESTRPVVAILDPTALLSPDGDTSSTSRGESEAGGDRGGGSSSMAAARNASGLEGGGEVLVSFSPTLSVVNSFHPLCYTPGYRRDQDEVRSERSPVQALKYLSGVELLAVSAGDLKLTFWAAGILTATSTSALETPVPLAVVHTPRPQRVLEWSAPTQRLFSISADLVITVWRVTAGRTGRCDVTRLASLKQHADLLQDLLVLNTDTLVSCGMDSLICLWDTQTLTPKGTRQGHRRGVRLLAKLSSQLFLSAGFEGDVLGWDVAALATTPVFRLGGHTAPVCCLQLIASSALASRNERVLRDAALSSSSSAVAAAATALLADQALTVDDDGWFKWWTLADVLLGSTESSDAAAEQSSSGSNSSSRRCLQTFRVGADAYPWKAHSLAVLQHGQTVVAAGPTHTLKLLERVRVRPPALASSVVLYNSVSFTLLTTADRELRIWDAASGALVRTYSGVVAADITCVDLDARQRKIVLGTQRGELVVLNYLNGAVLKHWTPHQLHVAALLYCKEDQCVLTASWDKSVRLYDDNAGENTNALLRCVTDAHDADIKCLAYCYALSLFASGSTDGAIKIWDYIYFLLEDTCSVPGSGTGEGGSSASLATHAAVHADVNALEFVEPYPLLLSAHENGMVCVWGLASTHKPTTLLVCFHPMAASPMGSSVPLHAAERSGAKREGVSCCQIFYDEDGGDVVASDIRRGRFLLLCGGTHGAVSVSDLSQVIAKSYVRAFREESLPSSHARSYNPRRRFLRQGKNAKRLRSRHSTTSGSSMGGATHHDDTEAAGDGNAHYSALRIEAADVMSAALWRAHTGSIRSLRIVDEPRAILTCASDKGIKVWTFGGVCVGNLAHRTARGGAKAASISSAAKNNGAWRWEIDTEAAARAKRAHAEAIWDEMKASKLKSAALRHQSVVDQGQKRRRWRAAGLTVSTSTPTLDPSLPRPESTVSGAASKDQCKSDTSLVVLGEDAVGGGADEGEQREPASEAARLFQQLHGEMTWKQSDLQVARQAAWELERAKFQQRMKKIMRAKHAASKLRQSDANSYGVEAPSSVIASANQAPVYQADTVALFESDDVTLALGDASLLPAFDKSAQALPYHDKDNWCIGSLNRERQMYTNLHYEHARRSQALVARLPRHRRGSASSREPIDLTPSLFLLEKLGTSCVVVENALPLSKAKPEPRHKLPRAEGDTEAPLVAHASMQELIRQYDRLMQDPPTEDDEERWRRTTKLLADVPKKAARRGSAYAQHARPPPHASQDDAEAAVQPSMSVKKVSSAPSSRRRPRSPATRPISSAKAKTKLKEAEGGRRGRAEPAESAATKKLRMRSDAALLRQERFGPHSRDDVVSIYRTFHKLDKDQSGTITLRELRDGAGLFSGSSLQDNIMSIFSSIDSDQSGHIDLSELLAAIFGGDSEPAPAVLQDIFRFCHLLEVAERAKKATKRQLTPAQLKELFALFKLYDVDRNGSIDADELFSALRYNDKFYESSSRGSQGQLTREDVQQIIAHFDVNTSATLDIDEFVELFREDA
ncbi:hypothetical protein PybrP1_004520 [[Pythium] brassicae (nom. inval.)]|nr:hypothetical protein PybrP1_004520 [[Pythium] brassicae (nom. inval.)]